jgi:signal transduction histidine kinase
MAEVGFASGASAPGTAAERMRARLAALTAISSQVARPLDLVELCRSIHREVRPVLEAESFLLALYDEASGSVEVVWQFDSGVELPGGSFPLGHGFMGQVIRTRQPRMIRHWSVEGPRVQIQYATGRPGLTESAIGVPLLFGEQVIGFLGVQSYEPDAFDEDDMLLLQAVGVLAAAGIENLRHSVRLNAQLWQRISELETILANMAEGLLIVDHAGSMVRMNHVARELLLVAESSLIVGQPLNRDWDGDHEVAEVLRTFLAAFQLGDSLEDVEVEIGGHPRVLSFSGAPLRGPTGSLTGGVIVFRDVTGRRDIERLKDQMLHEVEQKSRQLELAGRHKSEFMANMSHELRTPLNAIIGFSEVLQEGLFGELNEKQSDYVNDILDSGRHLLSLINDVLDISKVEAGRMELEPGKFSLIEALDRGLTIVRERASRNGIGLSLDVEGEIGPIEADERKIKQVIFNLLSNAVKFTPYGGHVEVVARLVDGHAEVAVRDSGPGIAPEDQERIFEDFRRAPGGGSAAVEGTGLGLPLARRFIELHGGQLWVESQPGLGSAFTFTLPLRA